MDHLTPGSAGFISAVVPEVGSFVVDFYLRWAWCGGRGGDGEKIEIVCSLASIHMVVCFCSRLFSVPKR